jgi:peptidoglycan biosynthesis protein MviN/MurJ (putative lipid II flippase)
LSKSLGVGRGGNRFGTNCIDVSFGNDFANDLPLSIIARVVDILFIYYFIINLSAISFDFLNSRESFKNNLFL